MTQTEFAKALGQAIAAGMVEAGLLESLQKTPETTSMATSLQNGKRRKRTAKPAGRRRHQPSANEPPPRPLRDVLIEGQERPPGDGAYELDADEPTAGEMAQLENMFKGRSEHVNPEMDAVALRTLETKLRVGQSAEPQKGTYDPDREERVAAHVMGPRR